MIVNPNKFQEMIMSCDKKENKCDSNISNSITISYVDFVAFLGIEIHSKWNFEKQVVTIIYFYICFYQSNIVYSIYLYISIYIYIYVSVDLYIYIYIYIYTKITNL